MTIPPFASPDSAANPVYVFDDPVQDSTGHVYTDAGASVAVLSAGTFLTVFHIRDNLGDTYLGMVVVTVASGIATPGPINHTSGTIAPRDDLESGSILVVSATKAIYFDHFRTAYADDHFSGSHTVRAYVLNISGTTVTVGGHLDIATSTAGTTLQDAQVSQHVAMKLSATRAVCFVSVADAAAEKIMLLDISGTTPTILSTATINDTAADQMSIVIKHGNILPLSATQFVVAWIQKYAPAGGPFDNPPNTVVGQWWSAASDTLTSIGTPHQLVASELDLSPTAFELDQLDTVLTHGHLFATFTRLRTATFHDWLSDGDTHNHLTGAPITSLGHWRLYTDSTVDGGTPPTNGQIAIGTGSFTDHAAITTTDAHTCFIGTDPSGNSTAYWPCVGGDAFRIGFTTRLDPADFPGGYVFEGNVEADHSYPYGFAIGLYLLGIDAAGHEYTLISDSMRYNTGAGYEYPFIQTHPATNADFTVSADLTLPLNMVGFRLVFSVGYDSGVLTDPPLTRQTWAPTTAKVLVKNVVVERLNSTSVGQRWYQLEASPSTPNSFPITTHQAPAVGFPTATTPRSTLEVTPTGVITSMPYSIYDERIGGTYVKERDTLTETAFPMSWGTPTLLPMPGEAAFVGGSDVLRADYSRAMAIDSAGTGLMVGLERLFKGASAHTYYSTYVRTFGVSVPAPVVGWEWGDVMFGSPGSGWSVHSLQ